jgi:hypothetical protein
MQRKFVLGVVLCLVAVAALAIGTAPALAVDGCTCHTSTPPTNGAPAAHDPYVSAVTDCTTCHRGWTVPHPTGVEATLSLFVDPRTKLSGQLKAGLGINGVTVYLQQQVPGVGDFSDVGQATTHARSGPIIKWNGVFDSTVASPVWGSTYRAVSQGVAGPPVVTPALAEALLTPYFSIPLRGLGKGGDLKPGRSVVATGKMNPSAPLAGEKVMFSLQRMTSKGWKVVQTGEATVSSAGTFAWKATPTKRGKTYEIYGTLPATAEHNACTRGAPHHFAVK